MRLKTLYHACVVLCLVLGCHEEPLTFDANGVAHGTGEKVYKYESGTTKLREAYVDSELVRSRWFKPDGTLIQETKWNHGNGEGIYLREDGTIRTRMQYVKGKAEGEAKEYDEAGNVIKTVIYHNGQPVDDDKPPTTHPSQSE